MDEDQMYWRDIPYIKHLKDLGKKTVPFPLFYFFYTGLEIKFIKIITVSIT